jgi:hypothetical protein
MNRASKGSIMKHGTLRPNGMAANDTPLDDEGQSGQ